MAKRKKNGRPTVITPSVEASIIAALRIGVTLGVSARAAGVSRATVYKHRKENKSFRTRVDRAVSEGEKELVNKITGNDQWQSAAWLLERRFGKRWGKKLDVTTNGKDIVLNPIVLDGGKEL